MLKYFSLTQEGRDLIATHVALESWLRTMESRPAVQRTQGSFERQ
jgi:hypothetical protein